MTDLILQFEQMGQGLIGSAWPVVYTLIQIVLVVVNHHQNNLDQGIDHWPGRAN